MPFFFCIHSRVLLTSHYKITIFRIRITIITTRNPNLFKSCKKIKKIVSLSFEDHIVKFQCVFWTPASSTMPLSLRIAPSPTVFRYSPASATAGSGGFTPVKQHCQIPNSGVATKNGFCSGGGGVLDSGKRGGSYAVRCSLETVNLIVGQVSEVDKDTFWPIVKAAGEKIVVLDMYTQW